MSRNNHFSKKEFHSSSKLPPKEIQAILTKKIHQEKATIKENSSNKNKKNEKDEFKKLKKQRITLRKKREALNKKRKKLKEPLINTHRIKIDSLFSGAGGLDLGVEMAGISAKYGPVVTYDAINNLKQFSELQDVSDIVYSNDLFKESNKTYSNNFKHFNDYFMKDPRDIKKVINFPKCDLMLGGFPCPGFSVAGPRLIDDPRNFLYINYVRALMNAKPKFFIGENVKGLTTMARGKVLQQIAEDFSSAGYKIDVNLVNARDYGVPQTRERVFIVGTRRDIAKSFQYHKPKPTNGIDGKAYVPLRVALAGIYKTKKERKNPKDHFKGGYSSIYMSRNRRRSWDDQSFTIQASGRQAPQYPGSAKMNKLGKNKYEFDPKDKNGWHRRLSAREEARIQCFPDWFKFQKGSSRLSYNSQLGKIYKQIGNAVPVYLAEHMARPIMEYLYNPKEYIKNHKNKDQEHFEQLSLNNTVNKK